MSLIQVSVKRDIKGWIYSYAPPPSPTTRKSPSFCFGFRPLFNTNSCSTHFILIRPGFRSCVMAPVPLKGNSFFRERRGAVLARRRLVLKLFFLKVWNPYSTLNIGSKSPTYPFFLERIRGKEL